MSSLLLLLLNKREGGESPCSEFAVAGSLRLHIRCPDLQHVRHVAVYILYNKAARISVWQVHREPAAGQQARQQLGLSAQGHTGEHSAVRPVAPAHPLAGQRGGQPRQCPQCTLGPQGLHAQGCPQHCTHLLNRLSSLARGRVHLGAVWRAPGSHQVCPC